jgi:hypothetical protein
MKRAGWLLPLALLGVLSPAELMAQTKGRVAIGASMSSKLAAHSDADGETGVGFLFRLGQGRDGWGWKYGLNWYSTDIERVAGDTRLTFGKLHIRPILAGYGYTRTFKQVKVSANLLGGIGFTSFAVEDDFDRLYRTTYTVQAIDTETSNVFVLRPEISAWRDLSEKLGLNVSVGYIVARPDVTVISSAGRDRRSVNADMFTFKVGLVYSIF